MAGVRLYWVQRPSRKQDGFERSRLHDSRPISNVCPRRRSSVRQAACSRCFLTQNGMAFVAVLRCVALVLTEFQNHVSTKTTSSALAMSDTGSSIHAPTRLRAGLSK